MEGIISTLFALEGRLVGSYATSSSSSLSIPAALFVRASSALMIVTGAATFLTLLYLAAPYGRYNKDTLSMGSMMPKIPARLAWVIMEFPNIWVTALVAALNIPLLGETDGDEEGSGGAQLRENMECCMGSMANRFLLGAFLAHYVHRSLIFPLRMSPDSAAMPAHVMLMALSFCVWNGLNQSIYLTRVHCYEDAWLRDPRFLIGAALFVLGAACNVHADYTLIALRRNGAGAGAGADRYQIPRGGLFEFVSAANYGGEILEWIGFAIACSSLPAVAFAVFTFCNTAPRGYQHHKWYLSKFKDYPRGRKAVIPFVW